MHFRATTLKVNDGFQAFSATQISIVSSKWHWKRVVICRLFLPCHLEGN